MQTALTVLVPVHRTCHPVIQRSVGLERDECRCGLIAVALLQRPWIARSSSVVVRFILTETLQRGAERQQMLPRYR